MMKSIQAFRKGLSEIFAQAFLKKACIVCTMLFSVCCVIALSAQVAFAAPEGGLIVAPRTDDSIKIDGKLDEWKLELFTDAQRIFLSPDTDFVNSGAIDDDDDFSAFIYALYDDDNLYLAAKVTDDALEKGFVGGNNWQNDCMEIWIDGAGDDGTMTDSGGNDPDNYQYNVDVNGAPYVYRNDDAAKLLAEMESASNVTGTNYTVETRIPFSAIPELDLKASRIMGFTISFVDSDKGVWSHILWQGQIDNNPAQWGDLEFSMETLSVRPAGKLPTAWGLIK